MPLPGLVGVIGRLSSGSYITLTDRTISDSVPVGEIAIATYQLGSDGTIKDQTGAILETWLPSGASSGSYQVLATLVSGTAPSNSSSSLDVWLSCSTSRSWHETAATQRFAGGVDIAEGVIRVKIRDALSRAVMASALITLYAQSGS